MTRSACVLAVVTLSITSLTACDMLKKKGAGSAGSASSTASAAPPATATSTAPAASAAAKTALPPATVTAPAATPMKGNPDLGALLGTKADGWNPKVFAALKENMTPAQAGKAFKYADAYDPNGIVDIPVGNVKGVQRYRLSYLDGKLKFGEIWFDASLLTPAFRAELAKACTAKWGNPEKSKPGDEDAMWIGPDFNSVTLHKIIDLHAEGWMIQVALK
jgi:hypothetical protein